ncbi:MAG: cytochrome c nitrite reductase small subunit [Helicobacteraceae bacterium]|jgi:cytochrome c nitrite reductase small subunit|nr:cytochrome c nitrite reductase small subunit [Helicobacteraceae bacterium]
MEKRRLLAVSAMATFLIAIGTFFYLLSVSRAFSYLSDSSASCINCHVMNTQYATWEHSAHREAASCVQCHLPSGGFDKYYAKVKDGVKHSVAFTFGTYDQTIRIGTDGEEVVQRNCIECHLISAKIPPQTAHKSEERGRLCWSCHRETPHGSVRALSTTPQNLGVQIIKERK